MQPLVCSIINTLNRTAMKARIFLAAAALVAVVAVANAQETKTTANPKGTGKNGTAYVDKNSNGVCDSYENGTSNRAKRSGKGAGHGNRHGHGKGSCSGQHQGKGNGANFVDKDGNGVCDNHEARTEKK